MTVSSGLCKERWPKPMSISWGVLATASPKPERIVLANVAGPDAGDRIREQLSAWLSVLSEVRSSSRCCGVTNLYSKPESLGVDRWCALIGARSLVQGAAVVVMAGTATTIDTIDADGQFLGGVILPGFELMAGSLARGTAALPMASGEYSIHPRCTDDAIVSGLIEAQAGAIERIFSRLNSRGATACCPAVTPNNSHISLSSPIASRTISLSKG